MLDGVATNKTRKENIRPGYEHINMHMRFEIKTDVKFNRKARLVVDDHTTAPP